VRVLRLLEWLGVVIVLMICIALYLGSRLPLEHTASVTDTIPASQQKVWGIIADVPSGPGWRTGLKAVTMLPPQNGAQCWAEVQSSMTMPLCADVREAPRRQIVRNRGSEATVWRDLDVSARASRRECDQGDDHGRRNDRAGHVALCGTLRHG
jgi:hypothetical protein